MTKEARNRLLKEAGKACEILQKIWADLCKDGDDADVSAANEAYRRAAMLRDHLENG